MCGSVCSKVEVFVYICVKASSKVEVSGVQLDGLLDDLVLKLVISEREMFAFSVETLSAHVYITKSDSIADCRFHCI